MSQSHFSFKEFRQVDRRHSLSVDQFESEYLAAKKPVILAGAHKEWPAMEKWSPEFFQSEFGNILVKFGQNEIKLGDYIDQISSADADNPAPYLYGIEMELLSPTLLDDIQPDSAYFRHDLFASKLNPVKLSLRSELLIGGPGTRFHLHYDIYHTHGFVTQVYGRKEFTLFSPADDEYMYPDPKRSNWSQIENIDQPNLNTFPNFQLAKPYRVVVNPGETIFQPSGWWHTTRLLEPCIGIVKSTVDHDLWNRFVNERYEKFIATNPINTRLKKGLLKFMSFTKVI